LFQLSQGYEHQRKKLIQIAEYHTRSYYACPESKLPKYPFESEIDADDRRESQYEIAKAEEIREFVDDIIFQWPGASISPPTSLKTYVKVQEVIKEAGPAFQAWYWNSQFRKYIQWTQLALDGLPRKKLEVGTYSFLRPLDIYDPKRGYICFDDLVQKPAPTLAPSMATNWSVISYGSRNKYFGMLQVLLNRLSSEYSGGYEQRYVEDLLQSFKAY
jgi:hypothetical protein